jgi:hypothetical protein
MSHMLAARDQPTPHLLAARDQSTSSHLLATRDQQSNSHLLAARDQPSSSHLLAAREQPSSSHLLAAREQPSSSTHVCRQSFFILRTMFLSLLDQFQNPEMSVPSQKLFNENYQCLCLTENKIK